MAQRLSNKQSKDLVYLRVNKGLCPICGLEPIQSKETQYDGVTIRLCRQHVLSVGVIPIELDKT